jgi:hypothetical protein
MGPERKAKASYWLKESADVSDSQHRPKKVSMPMFCHRPARYGQECGTHETERNNGHDTHICDSWLLFCSCTIRADWD